MSRLSRARGVLAQGGWLDQPAGATAYSLRRGGDRRAAVVLTLDEAAFRALVVSPGLRARSGGGWIAARAEAVEAASAPGRPGHIDGRREIAAPDGRLVSLPANLGHSPLVWLARRTDADGRAFLSPAEVAAGERLRADAEMAMSGPSLTMRWDALPRSGGGSSARVEAGDRALNAARRVARALAACDPAHRALVERVCIHDTALQIAERETGLRRREGKRSLKAGLEALARHYGML